MSKVYHFKRTQILPCSLEQAWAFFSNPDNLAKITPPSVKMKVISGQGTHMYAGQIIEYKMRPLLGIPFYWMTEVTHTEQHKYFVDEQRFGPYSLWHHQHHFKETPAGTEMTDIVHYKLPFWFLGDIAHVLFVKKKVREIFDYRFKAVENGIWNW